MEFEWDELKERVNFQKHKITFVESIETFYDPHGIKLIDHGHSISELRYFWVGKLQNNRVLTTWFTERDGKIRIIGCAEWRKFRRIYNETAQIK